VQIRNLQHRIADAYAVGRIRVSVYFAMTPELIYKINTRFDMSMLWSLRVFNLRSMRYSCPDFALSLKGAETLRGPVAA